MSTLRKSIVLVQPREGIYNRVLKPWVPLSLLSAVSRVDIKGYPITIIDQRIDKEWDRQLVDALAQEPICVGITSMTGSQILGALEASRLVKKHSKIPVVWGGVHPTLFPAETLHNEFVDIVIRGEGEETFYDLIKRLENKGSLRDLQGVWYKADGRIFENKDRPFIDLNEEPHTPYHLVNLNHYLHHFFSEKDVIEIESSRGCPFACAFCYNAAYSKRTWRALHPEKVVERMKELIHRFSCHSFHFIDDAFFVNKERVREIMRRIIQEDLKVAMGFQGVRVDHFAQMDAEDLALFEKAGGRFLQFGVESGSPRILEIINKKIEVDQVIELNQRLANYPHLIPYYNFMCGFPTETREDLLKTAALARTLLNENKQSMISPFHHYKAYPGTPLFEVTGNRHCTTPRTLEEWGRFDWTELTRQEGDRKMMRLRKNMEFISVFVDKKMENQSDSHFWTWMAKLYRPIARYRLKKDLYSLMPEGLLLHQLERGMVFMREMGNWKKLKIKYLIVLFGAGVLFFLSHCGGPGVSSISREVDEIKVSPEWGPVEKLPPPVNSTEWEDGPSISPDGKMIYFTRGKGREVESYVSRRVGDGWSHPTPLDFNLKSFPTGAPHTQDESVLYFASIRPGGHGSGDIYISTKKEDGRWSPGINLGKPVNTKYMESEPFISPDHMALYFASDRPGGQGKADIWMAKKKGSGWGEPINLGTPVNSSFEETQPFVTQDGRELYFTAMNRKGIPGPAIFRSTRKGDQWGEPEVVISGFVGEPTLTADKQSLYFVHIIHKGGKLLDAEIMSTKRR